MDFVYPENLIATERQPKSRIMFVPPESATPVELADLSQLLEQFKSGDCLVINESRVLRRRVFAESGLEILFLAPLGESGGADARRRWQVMCPSSRWKEGVLQTLPGGVKLALLSRGRQQEVEADRSLDEAYFEQHGELPLPPYIQKARGERHNRQKDTAAYQTEWARLDGSLAAPTASLHFSNQDLDVLREKGVSVVPVVLHVGLGTFLPITAPTLDEHVMHAEWAEIPAATWQAVKDCAQRGGRVWALGTTVTRTLESAAAGKLSAQRDGFAGWTDLFIRPGFEWRVVQGLLTNFHQPKSTLLALVSAFSGERRVLDAYAWAIERKFRLFSYGDLTVWIR